MIGPPPDRPPTPPPPWWAVELMKRIERIEEHLKENAAALRAATAEIRRVAGLPPTKPPPKPRQQRDGSWVTWGGEGTGWIPCDPPSRTNGEKK